LVTQKDAHWFESVARYLGDSYLKYSFTKGTKQEIDFLVETLPLREGDRVIDIGCGPGRHCIELALRGYRAFGIDISETFIEQAKASAVEGASFRRLDARALQNEDELHEKFDAAVCLCQGAFGVMLDDSDDLDVLRGAVAVLRPGGLLALSAFNSYFSIRHHTDAEFDVGRGVSHERTVLRNPAGESLETDLWTGCYTPRELRMACSLVGLEVVQIHGVEPGNYGLQDPSVDLPECLLIARKPL
jgi:SAM-dependent methyltransferase